MTMNPQVRVMTLGVKDLNGRRNSIVASWRHWPFSGARRRRSHILVMVRHGNNPAAARSKVRASIAPASAPEARRRGLAGAFSEGGSEPRDRSSPAKRRARERVGESEGRSPSEKTGGKR